MCSRSRVASLALIALAGCDRETRESRGQPLPEGVPRAETTTLYAGAPHPVPPDPRAKMYEANAFHISEGQRLYSWMNCVGCHAHGGGGMGPPLIDAEWRYGNRMEQIAQTIVQGRPNGMPSFRGKLTEQQVWQLAAYVRSMAGKVPKDAPPSRGDEVSNTEALTLKEEDATAQGSAVISTAPTR